MDGTGEEHPFPDGLIWSHPTETTTNWSRRCFGCPEQTLVGWVCELEVSNVKNLHPRVQQRFRTVFGGSIATHRFKGCHDPYHDGERFCEGGAAWVTPWQLAYRRFDVRWNEEDVTKEEETTTDRDRAKTVHCFRRRSWVGENPDQNSWICLLGWWCFWRIRSHGNSLSFLFGWWCFRDSIPW